MPWTRSSHGASEPFFSLPETFCLPSRKRSLSPPGNVAGEVEAARSVPGSSESPRGVPSVGEAPRGALAVGESPVATKAIRG